MFKVALSSSLVLWGMLNVSSAAGKCIVTVKQALEKPGGGVGIAVLLEYKLLIIGLSFIRVF